MIDRKIYGDGEYYAAFQGGVHIAGGHDLEDVKKWARKYQGDVYQLFDDGYCRIFEWAGKSLKARE